MSRAKPRRTERQAIVDAVYAQHRAKQRKRNILLSAGLGLLAVAIITVVAIAITN